ncbi:BatA and WFA domain-containing protein [Sporosarcina sp. OR05]|uniref:vWA domain-containing protein n=1 Tax=Sporosarcina sp. OR05 TaxID=2969819 RepID=UPI00352A6F39
MGLDQLNNLWTAIFPLAVLLYYFFRKKYVTTTISSTLFWERSMRETKVSPYLKNLQQNALFYLQMAALLLFLFVLLKPYVAEENVVGEHSIFVIDTSASMGAMVDGVSLFERNKKKLLALAEEKEGEAISVITTGKEPSFLLREEKDLRLILGTIDQLELNYEHEHMDRAIEIVQSIAKTGGADVHIFTDYLDRSFFMENENGISWNVHNNDKPLTNIAIEKFGAVSSQNHTEAIVKLKNESAMKLEGTVLLKNELTGEQLASENVVVEGQSEELLSFKELPVMTVVSVKIEAEDDYLLDNEAIVLLGKESTEVIVDVQLHELVKKAFEAIGLAVTTGSTNELNLSRDQAMLVTNQTSFLDEGTEPILLIGRNDVPAEEVAGDIETVPNPLFTVASIEEVYVSELYPPFEGFTTLASINDRPFIQQSSRGDIVVLTDIDLTDWPLHPSFPLFFWSASELLTTDRELIGSFTPNERKAIVTGGVESLELFTLDDQYVTTFADGNSFVAPSKPGIYKLLDEGDENFLSVQLDAAEKTVADGKGYQLGSTQQKNQEEGKRLIGWLFLLPVLLLLVLEWEVQRRRGYPNS